MRILIATLAILFGLCILTVSYFNPERVTVQLWPDPDYTYPDTAVSWVIFFSAAAGVTFMGIIALIEGSKIRLSNARLRLQVRSLQQEIEALRRPPVQFASSPPAIPQPLPAAAEIDEKTEEIEGA